MPQKFILLIYILGWERKKRAKKEKKEKGHERLAPLSLFIL